jgi:hypothetical protein
MIFASARAGEVDARASERAPPRQRETQNLHSEIQYSPALPLMLRRVPRAVSFSVFPHFSSVYRSPEDARNLIMLFNSPSSDLIFQ